MNYLGWTEWCLRNSIIIICILTFGLILYTIGGIILIAIASIRFILEKRRDPSDLEKKSD